MTLYKKEGRRYVEQGRMAGAEHFDMHSLLIGACRYYLGRRTIATVYFAQYELAVAWPSLREGTRRILRREIQEALDSDAKAREAGETWGLIGDECDRSAWEAVRAAWLRHDGEVKP